MFAAIRRASSLLKQCRQHADHANDYCCKRRKECASNSRSLRACACSPSHLKPNWRFGSETGRKLDQLLNQLLADPLEFSTPCAAIISPQRRKIFRERPRAPFVCSFILNQ
jgi:hypothetical protein